MWTMVSGGPETMWVKTDECRLVNGELAFVDKLGSAPPPPEWLVGPEGSELQETHDARAGGECLWEFRSLRASAEDVLAYYRELIEGVGLAILPDRRPDSLCLGFRAKNTEFGFHIYVYERKGLSFWNTGLDTESYKKRKWEPGYLHFLEQDHERIKMKSEGNRPKECWAPVDALRCTDPPIERHCTFTTQPILWSSLPRWIQFNIEEGRVGEVYLWEEEDGSKGWNAQISAQIEGDPRCTFESRLDDLEAQGFEMNGVVGPGPSYYISVLGNWLTVHFKSEAGDGGLVRVHGTYHQWKCEAAYVPSPGTPPPGMHC
jgi:hypothetical protein